ncbi:MAG: FAD-binding oxidoreductase, partial [Proteobacteria bacterium]|nr:FAD-binding oxidoreductase [Pseudomonadota bacterium]
MTEELLKKLRAAVPSAIILTSDDDCTNYGMDWTRTPGKAGVVVLPSSTQDVSVVLRFCNENK